MSRVGLGQDSHRFDENIKKPLMLGGIKVDENNGLKANSDGDVVLHAICNALSSAIGGDSLGTWADDMCLKKGIKDSRKYVEYILDKVKDKNYEVENISLSIEAKKPYLSKEITGKIKDEIAYLLEINENQVGMTFTSGEGLTSYGKGEGMQVLAIVYLTKK